LINGNHVTVMEGKQAEDFEKKRKLAKEKLRVI